jgi:sugar lactone lactonase YvrE
MSAKRFLCVAGLTFILLATLVGQGRAQGQQPLQLPQPTPPAHPPSYPPIYPPGRDESQAEGKIPAQATSNVSAQSIALGPSGTSFRYLQTFGVTEEAYPADVQHINNPAAVFVDGSDDLFVVEDLGSRVLKYRTSDGANLLSIGKAGLQNRDSYTFDRPTDVAVDGDGNFWVVDNHRVAKYNASGHFLLEFPSADPWATGSDNNHFNQPRGLAFDSAGRLYVSDANNERIQVFDIVSGTPAYNSTIGVTGVPGSGDGYFNFPSHIAFDSSGRLYVADSNNYRVQRCTLGGSTWTCANFFGEAGVGGTDLTHLGIWFNGLTIRNDDLFIADDNNHRVLKCNLTGTCSLFAGVTGVIGIDNAHMSSPSDVSVDSTGNVYVSEYDNGRVQEFTSSGVWVKTFGVTQVPYVPDASRYNAPRGISVATDGSIYFTEGWGYRLVKLNAAGDEQWTAGQAGDWGSDNAHFGVVWWDGLPGSMAVDKTGRVYVPDTGNDRIQIFNASTGAFITTWGSSGSGHSQFSCPWGVSISPVNGDFYVADRCNNRIQVFNSSRVYKTQLGSGNYGSSNTEFASPQGVAVDKHGNIYVADMDNNRVQKCTLSGVSYTCSVFAGVTGEWGDDFGHLSGPYSVAVDASDRVYVADAWNQRVQVFDSAGAYLTTIGGSWGSNSGQLREPKGVALDSQGNVYVSDSRNGRIQKFALGVPDWVQANINGFGDRYNRGATALEGFNGQLYAGASNWDEGARIWRTSDGIIWTVVSDPGFGNVYASTNIGIPDMVVFNGKLYASTGWAGVGGQVWRSSYGTDWTQVEANGFGDGTNAGISAFVVFNNSLYASTDVRYTGATHGLQIWRSSTGDSLSWTNVVSNGFNDNINNTFVSGFSEYGGYLYAAVENATDGLEIWRTSDGEIWTQANTSGFGDTNNGSTGGLAVLDGYLYCGTYNYNGGQLWRSNNGTTWEQVINNGFGDGNNTELQSLFVFRDDLYTIASNDVTGLEVWRSADGSTWSQVAIDGFGDSNNSASLWSNAASAFNNRLFIGTWNWNGNGGEIWRDDFDHGKPAPPTVPALVAPANNALITDTTPLLDWKSSNLPKGVIFDHYQLQVATVKTFNPTLLDVDISGITNSNYTFASDLTLNTKYYWRVRAYNLYGNASPWSGVRYFRTALPAPIGLGYDAIQNLRPRLYWSMPTDTPGPAATGYTVQISTASDFKKLVRTGTSASTSYTPTADLPRNQTTLYWRVRANGLNGPSDWSANGTFSTGNPPSIPKLVAPANNALTTNYQPVLDWSNSTVPVGAPAFDHYRLQVADNTGFTSPTIDKSVAGPATNSSYTPDAGSLAPNTKYYWHVQACNSNSECSAWSSVRYFRAALLPPALLLPADGSTSTSLKPTFTWNSVTGAKGYTIQIAKSTGLVGTYTVKTTSYTPAAKLPVGQLLHWRVRSNGPNGPSDWSEQWSLTINP